ncbi:MAG: cytochrome c3 family protein [Candidatus Hydrogenedentes bacterium]|nr:cytochrome c3 family protein [Candidatus Hydrogenedentota bacterium]
MFSVFLLAAIAQEQATRDPAAWGSDHAGKPVPVYEDGNTCLFCHRTSIGPSWQTNRHATTIRGIDDEVRAKQLREIVNGAELVLGRNEVLRFLKRSESYGAMGIHDAKWSLRENAWRDTNRQARGEWRAAHFGERCAGCHTSGVDSAAKTFQMLSLDCHTCHGVMVPEHTEDGALMLLAKKARTLPEVEISICGACHLRGGASRSTGFPFPNNFVPGDNLFKDFQADLSRERIAKENPGDGHIRWITRDVAINGEMKMTCTTCHDVHAQSSKKHTKVAKQPVCFTCHIEGEPMQRVRTYERHNATCEY